MQRNIIVQQRRIEPNYERSDLSSKTNRQNLQTPKTQDVFHTNSIFDELELVIEISQALEPHMDKTQIRTKKDDAKYANV
jgi:hypothetical protein